MKTRAMDPLPSPTCGRLLPSGALQGLCPACLLAQGAETVGYPGFAPPPAVEVARLFPQPKILGLLESGGMGAVDQARGGKPARHLGCGPKLARVRCSRFAPHASP